MAALTTPPIAPPTAGQPRSFDLAGIGCALLGATGLLAEYAFNEPPVALAWCQAAQVVAVLGFLTLRLVPRQGIGWVARLREHWLDLAVLPAAGAAAIAIGVPSLVTIRQAAAIYVVLRQAGLTATTVLEKAVQEVVRPGSRWQAARLMTASYLVVVVLGGALLALPKATTADHRNMPYTHLLNSAFAATSATCSAGLNVYELPRDYTLFGQAVILGLIQAGGLGMLVFGTLFGMLLVRQLSGEQDGPVWMDRSRVRRIVAAIVGTTVALEGLGAVLLYPAWADQPAGLERGFHAVFHSVGAFCNAGFTLQKDNLIGRSDLWQVYGVILPLAVVGSLGFPVLYEVIYRMRRQHRKGVTPLLPLPGRGWSLHTRLVLVTTLCLVAGGMLGLLYFETPGRIGYWYVGKGNLLALRDALQLSPDWMRSHLGPQRLFDGLFQSAVAPTAGLHTIPVEPGAVSPASQFLLMVLMFVGGAPASTAGGIKTVALAVLVLYVVSILRRKRQAEAFGQPIPGRVVRAALGVFFVSIAWLTLTVLALAHVERAGFLAIAFEAVSAFSNNGLSLGLTPNLTALGKGILLLTMLAGRIGPLALVMGLAGQDEGSQQEKAGETVVLG